VRQHGSVKSRQEAREDLTMNATKTKLGLLGAIVFAMIALPAYAAPPRGRADDRRGTAANRGRDRDAVNGCIRIEPGHDRRPGPIRYETRTETVPVEPAHYEIRTHKVLVMAGRWQERAIPGKSEWLRDARGNLHQVRITPDRVERIWCPPLYETRTVKVLAPARYVTRTVRVPVMDRYNDRTSTTKVAIGIGLRILDQVLHR